MQVSKKSHPKKLLLNCQLNISGQDPCSTAFFVNKHITTSYQLSASNSHNITMIFLSSSTCLHLIALVHTYSCRETFLVHRRNSQRYENTIPRHLFSLQWRHYRGTKGIHLRFLYCSLGCYRIYSLYLRSIWVGFSLRQRFVFPRETSV